MPIAIIRVVEEHVINAAIASRPLRPTISPAPYIRCETKEALSSGMPSDSATAETAILLKSASALAVIDEEAFYVETLPGQKLGAGRRVNAAARSEPALFRLMDLA